MRTANLKLVNVDMKHVDINFDIHKKAVFPNVNISLLVNLEPQGNLKLSPMLATFNLSTNVIEGYPIEALSYSMFNISRNEQLIILRFEPHPILLPPKKMRYLKNKLQDKDIWFNLDGDFK